MGTAGSFDNYPKTMTSDQVAELLGHTVNTVRGLAREGRIPAHRGASQWRFDRDEIVDWLRSDETRVTPAD